MMRILNRPFPYLLILILFLSVCDVLGQQKHNGSKYYWRNSRGVNAGTNLTEQDVADLKSWNANLLRISLATLPLIEMEPPYNINGVAFQYLDSVLNWCEEYDISVIIDPHKYPGMGHQWTMLGTDSVWLDFKYHNIIIKVWDEISKRYKDRGKVIAAYDILNEPETKPIMDIGTPNDINLLYRNVVAAIRKNDSKHTISIALPRYYKNGKMYGYHKGIELIQLPNDDNLVLQTHTYMPEKFTHQNVWEDGSPVHYPGIIDDEKWNLQHLKEVQSELILFSRKNPKIPILIGEFSCPRWTGKDGVQYLKDVIQIAEENNWSWAYHSFRESHIWDAELSAENKADNSNKDYSNQRLRMLKSSFKKNIID